MIFSIIFISLLGTILHFTYDFSNHNKVVGLFSAVNESTWEHIKIALSATFVFSIIDGFSLGSNPNYFFAKFVSLLVIIVLIPFIFYTYKHFLKRSILIVDILIFYVAIFFSQLIFNDIINSNYVPYFLSYIGVLGTFVIFGFYMVLTLFPIKNFLFKDPITKKYGIKGHRFMFFRK